MSDLIKFSPELPSLSSFIKPTKDQDIFELALKKRIITSEMIQWYLDKAAVLHIDALKEETVIKERLMVLSEFPHKLIQNRISKFSLDCMQRPKFTSELDERGVPSEINKTGNVDWRQFIPMLSQKIVEAAKKDYLAEIESISKMMIMYNDETIGTDAKNELIKLYMLNFD